MDDQAIRTGLRRGDMDALEAAITGYGAYVAAVIRNQLGETARAEDAEEIAADVFCALWQNRKTLKTTHIRGWLGSTARNRARTFLRQKRRDPIPLEDVITVADEDAVRLLEERERARVIRRALAALGPEDREIFVRYYYYNETIPAIAKDMGRHPEAVKSRLRRGRAKLKEILRQEGYDT